MSLPVFGTVLMEVVSTKLIFTELIFVDVFSSILFNLYHFFNLLSYHNSTQVYL